MRMRVHTFTSKPKKRKQVNLLKKAMPFSMQPINFVFFFSLAYLGVLKMADSVSTASQFIKFHVHVIKCVVFEQKSRKITRVSR